MSPKESFHLLGYLFGLAAFVLIYWSARPTLLAQGRLVHLRVLMPIHFFRYFGLTALLPGIFDLAPEGFSYDYLWQIMAGDVAVAILALGTFALILTRPGWGIPAAWVFNLLGTLDYLNAAARVTPAIHDANTLGPFGWMIVTVFLPAWLVSHIAIFAVLLGWGIPASRHDAPTPVG